MKTYTRSRLTPAFILAVVLALLPRISGAQTYNVIHAFSALAGSGTNADGVQSDANLVTGTDGLLYGVASGGGAHGAGTVFKVTRDGAAFTTLHSFDSVDANGDNVQGAGPESALVAGTDGFLYGTTPQGGPNGDGTIFKISSNGSSFTVLHSFTDTTGTNSSFDSNADGAEPFASMIFGPGGFLYGITRYGGANGTGCIFKMSTDGSTFTTLYSFSDVTVSLDPENGTNQDGAFPLAALTLAKDGNMYGTTSGGGPNQTGTVFKFDPTTLGVTVLHQFSDKSSVVQGVNPDGANPNTSVIQGSGTDTNLYGTTTNGGGNGLGTIFRISTDGQTFTTLYTFSQFGATEFNSDGANPNAPLVLGTDGNFYGTASAGGQNTFGTIYELSADGSSFSTLYSFQQSDGTVPNAALLVGTGGYFYGTTSSGGASSGSLLGSVYQFKPAPLGSGTFQVTTTAMPSVATTNSTISAGGTYVSGSTATVTAVAGDGWVFKNWFVNGAVVSTSTSYSFTVTEIGNWWQTLNR